MRAAPLVMALVGCGTSWFEQDVDRDGYTVSEGDCWDREDGPEGTGLQGTTIHPGAAETWYDGFDQDCAGDDDFDADADGFVADGHAGAATAGVPGSGALSAGDCDDADPLAWPGAAETWYDGADADCAGDDDYDADADGYGHARYGGDDCDDADGSVHPGAAETWYDGVDTDCAGDDDDDADADGEAALDRGGTDCDDADPLVNSRATETWYDGVDGDCAGDDDDDADGDGHPAASAGGDDCDDADAAVHPGALESWYDGVDGDCAGDDDDDADGDGYAADLRGGPDCDDADAAVNPGASESCATAADDDCDGDDNDEGGTGCTLWYLDSDGDGYGYDARNACLCTSTALYSTTMGGDCLDGGAYLGVDPWHVYPAAIELCDGVDDDCDGLVDDDDPDLVGYATFYRDADGDGYGSSGASVAACELPSGYATNALDCDDGAATVNPAATEVCDAADTDEDCNGLADDADGAVTGRSTWYTDADGDGYGDAAGAVERCERPGGAVSDDSDCDDADGDVNPGAEERCATAGVDDDCDGTADEADAADATVSWADADLDGYGDPDAPTTACTPPTGNVSDDTDCDDGDGGVHPGAGDGTADGVDDDCDGWVDEDLVSAGDLVLVEVMADPLAPGVQWVELYNSAGRELHLDGWQVAGSASGEAFCLSSDAAISLVASGLVVLCAEGASLGTAACDYTWTTNAWEDFSTDCAAAADLELDPAGDTLALYADTLLVDVVTWDASFPLGAGRSMEAPLGSRSAAANDAPGGWCAADTGSLYDGVNAGTPGDLPSCP